MRGGVSTESTVAVATRQLTSRGVRLLFRLYWGRGGHLCQARNHQKRTPSFLTRVGKWRSNYPRTGPDRTGPVAGGSVSGATWWRMFHTGANTRARLYKTLHSDSFSLASRAATVNICTNTFVQEERFKKTKEERSFDGNMMKLCCISTALIR